jgi:hypothetical protein
LPRKATVKEPHRDHTSVFSGLYDEDDRMVERKRLACDLLAFPSRETLRSRLDAGGVLGNDESRLSNVRRQLRVRRRVIAIDRATAAPYDEQARAPTIETAGRLSSSSSAPPRHEQDGRQDPRWRNGDNSQFVLARFLGGDPRTLLSVGKRGTGAGRVSSDPAGTGRRP